MDNTIKKLDDLITEIDNKSIGIIESFSQHLTQQGLVKKTIKNHIGNLEFFVSYLNRYANSKDELKLISQADASDISSFSLNFFPDKALWANASSAKQNITSFKKFYSWLYEERQISTEHYQDIINTIKEEKADWIESVGGYEDDGGIW